MDHQQIYNNGFYVYANSNPEDKSSQYSKNVAGCVNYMMRYASRPPMAESRIISYDEDNDDVCWFYDDHATNERITVKKKHTNKANRGYRNQKINGI